MTDDYADIEVEGKIDKPSGQLCMNVVAKSVNGIVRSDFPYRQQIVLNKQFRVVVRVLKPEKLGVNKVDHVNITISLCGKEIISSRSYDFQNNWEDESSDKQLSRNILDHPEMILYWNLQEEDFSSLDALLAQWNSESERDQNGDWYLDGFNIIFHYSLRNRDWDRELGQIRKWRKSNPLSTGAAIAEARYWMSYAKNIRGNEDQKSTNAIVNKIYNKYMKKSRIILEESKGYASDNPLWYSTYIHLLATMSDDKALKSVFEEGVRRHPYYIRLYLDLLSYIMADYETSIKFTEIDAIVNRAVDNTENVDGTSAYAMLYSQISYLQPDTFNIFRDSHASWLKMKMSFKDLLARYQSALNMNKFAAFSCIAYDREAFLTLKPQLNNRIILDAWPSNHSPELCEQRFMQKI